jgi:Icc-related predicted phosphoesterase
MRIVCISDCHGRLPQIPACDLLLIAGDITPVSDHSEEFQKRWLQTHFHPWLEKAPAIHVCGIAGNHDYIFQRQPTWVPKDLRWIYLQDSGTEIEGLKIFGTPWQPWFQDWAFNSPKENPEEFLAQKFSQIPDDTDILLAHGAPKGYGDMAPAGGPGAGEHVGSSALLNRILEVCPALVVYGHLHGGYGFYSIPGEKRVITLANASVLDEKYQLANRPLEILLEQRKRGITISKVG